MWTYLYVCLQAKWENRKFVDPESNTTKVIVDAVLTINHASRQETLTPRLNQPATRVAAVSSDTKDRSATGGCVARELVDRPDVSISFFVGRGGV